MKAKMKMLKKKYVKPLVELESVDDDLMLTGSHTTTANLGDSPITEQEDYPGYKGEIDPDDPGFEFYF